MRSGNASQGLWLELLLLVECGLFAGVCLGGKKKAWSKTQLSAAFRGAPESGSALRNPYSGQTEAIQAGGKLFHQYCAQCHGQKAEGLGNAPPLRSSVIREAPDGLLFWFLKNGKLRKGMPSWSGLPAAQRWQIVSFLKSLQ